MRSCWLFARKFEYKGIQKQQAREGEGRREKEMSPSQAKKYHSCLSRNEGQCRMKAEGLLLKLIERHDPQARRTPLADRFKR
jgi:hypothetical protein